MNFDATINMVFFVLCVLTIIPIVMNIAFFLYTIWKLLPYVTLCVMVGAMSAKYPSHTTMWVSVGVLYLILFLLFVHKGKYNDPRND